MSDKAFHPITPYGTAIHDAISDGNLQQMKTLLKQRDVSKPEDKELASAYDALTQEVSRLEKN
ncbi:DUF1843 domain-containing protein [Pseudomonas cichorii]|uniref:DUF1843 domain-containing protein n=1 Tax=Pseudomonas cichorii TaxID=36746 RepID=UPI0018E607CC|nr:DUF1843 domain-containing protein [Pseudomonas cichorii]MBI6853766.1 DUF1843 domain-containing protein [Pseudomonas cichorii]